MGDFFLDLREADCRRRSAEIAAANLRWWPESNVSQVETDHVSLVIARSDCYKLWGPSVWGEGPNRVVAALAGRIALSAPQWEAAARSDARGGLACRAVIDMYRQAGVKAVEALSGNFALVLLDEGSSRCHVVTDRAGMVLCYGLRPSTGSPVVCSHPDVLARALDVEQDLDMASLAEFVVSGRLTFPYTYYRSIEAMQWGGSYTFELLNGKWVPRGPRRYFEIAPQFDSAATEADLADGLAEAFRKAVTSRSLPVLGKTAVAMSGGMDSRAVLSCVEDPGRIEGFGLIDAENPESQAARAIAGACGTSFRAIRRGFDHYGEAAELGARIGGGMGCLASNHFLGIRDWLEEEGIQNLLTGCYCDYLFKALALNTVEKPLSRREILLRTQLEFYRPIYDVSSRYEEAVRARFSEWIPLLPAEHASDAELFEVEQRRIFPLASEADSAQRVIAQRVLPWFVPMADNDLIDMYQRIPPRMKLNGCVFRAMLRRLCKPEVLRVPNSNTGAPVLADGWSRAFHRYRSAFLNRWNSSIGGGIAGRGSWPNWEFYLQNSKLVSNQWQRRGLGATEILAEVVEPELLDRPIADFRGRDVELFQRLWTLKLWLEQRMSRTKPAVTPSNNLVEALQGSETTN